MMSDATVLFFTKNLPALFAKTVPHIRTFAYPRALRQSFVHIKRLISKVLTRALLRPPSHPLLPNTPRRVV